MDEEAGGSWLKSMDPLGKIDMNSAQSQDCFLLSLPHDLLGLLVSVICSKPPRLPQACPDTRKRTISRRTEVLLGDDLFYLLETCKLMHNALQPFVKWYNPDELRAQIVGYYHDQRRRKYTKKSRIGITEGFHLAFRLFLGEENDEFEGTFYEISQNREKVTGTWSITRNRNCRAIFLHLVEKKPNKIPTKAKNIDLRDLQTFRVDPDEYHSGEAARWRGNNGPVDYSYLDEMKIDCRTLLHRIQGTLYIGFNFGHKDSSNAVIIIPPSEELSLLDKLSFLMTPELSLLVKSSEGLDPKLLSNPDLCVEVLLRWNRL